MKKILLITLLVARLITDSKANNIVLNNVSVLNNAGNTVKLIEFDISWENSWRVASTGNYDGGWIFFKFKDNDGKWKHLNFTGTDITIPSGAAYTIGNSAGTVGVGLFIYRSGLGSGTFTALNVRAGIQNYPGLFDVKGFAIEMVYIPQGSFYIGDGNFPANTFTFREGNTSNPYQVTGNGNTITFGAGAGQLQPGGTSGNLAGYPAGYSPYWIMKYELSQGGYRDFLNTLTYDQQISRLPVAITSATGTRLTGAPDIALEFAAPGVTSTETPAIIGCDASNNNVFNESADGEWRTMGMISWPDAAAYLDWAGLRPMTELEYEKACRGPLTPVLNEFAWGTATISLTTYTLVNHDQNNSSVSNASSTEGNAIVNDNHGTPTHYRGGIFANAGSSRISSGAGYFGAMELSGNVGEIMVSATNTAGKSYTGRHGDGGIDASGNADENYWPGINGNIDGNTASTVYAGTGVTGGGGVFHRGGSHIDPSSFADISHRTGTSNLGNQRQPHYGIRGVRD